ncbi:MAG: inositol monophosphatase family protein [Pseudomonadota bacterium]
MITDPALKPRQDIGRAEDIRKLEEIILAAGERARELFNGREAFFVNEKSPGQFVSDADREVENLIRDMLREAFGKLPVIGEEFGGEYDGNGWVIDPIDGTSNFLCGLPLWSISIAYMRDGSPELAAVYAPNSGSLASASKGHGIRRNCQTHVRKSGRTAVPTYSVGENTVWSRESIRQTTERLREEGYEIVRLRSASQSLAMVSLGLLDGFIEEHLKLWDIAAGWLLCIESGVPVSVGELEGFERSIWAGYAGAPDVR